MNKKDRELYDEALAIIDDNLQVVEGIIGNRFATASLIVEFAKKQVENLAIHDVSNRRELLIGYHLNTLFDQKSEENRKWAEAMVDQYLKTN